MSILEELNPAQREAAAATKGPRSRPSRCRIGQDPRPDL